MALRCVDGRDSGAVSTGDCGREAMRRWIRLPLCAPCTWIQLQRRGSSAVAGGASADPAPPSSRMDPARVKTMGRRQDGGNLRGGELVLRHPWSSGGHPWRRRHRACLSPSFPFSSSSPAEGVATARCFRSQSGNHREPPLFPFNGSRRRRKLLGSTTQSINYFS
ncbi:Os12g0577350 [Oryza sativa Japonica Group]|uniref:Os12g0577350 protein n=1 Tax=Oryza sativa subsp. japonica TaxID=39947 RepID=A0A0P0YCH1_ORYSJ|nr:Os12g0577350 [Oryza sativa Japonica Group]